MNFDRGISRQKYLAPAPLYTCAEEQPIFFLCVSLYEDDAEDDSVLLCPQSVLSKE